MANTIAATKAARKTSFAGVVLSFDATPEPEELVVNPSSDSFL